VDFFNRHPGLRRVVAAILAALTSSGCVSWWSVRNADSYVTNQRPSRVRVTLVDREQFELYGPTVVDSQLVGRRGTEADWAEISIPLRQVRSVEVAHVNPGGVVATLAVIAVIVSVISLNNFHLFGPGLFSGWHQ